MSQCWSWVKIYTRRLW